MYIPILRPRNADGVGPTGRLADISASSPPPPFVSSSSNPSAHVAQVVKAVLKARRIAVVCGAGISVQAGIPDFRSQDGLFQTLRKDNPSLASGKDLFDVSVFNNIDALEYKSGLSFGVPELDDKRCRPKCKVKEKGNSSSSPVSCLPSPPAETPRCIPLHGTLQTMHCQVCIHTFPLEDHLPDLAAGTPPFCPECTALEETRQLVGKRSRGVGKLRPSVVLYNEEHKDGEEVGEVVRRDLMGHPKGRGRSGADLLLVVGTSLKIPGTKRIVREFSKAVHSRPSGSPNSISTPVSDDDPPIKTVYLNLDFPVPVREWEGVFDVWLQGDIQTFAEMVQDELRKEAKAKAMAEERKRKRIEALQDAAGTTTADPDSSPQKKRRVDSLLTPARSRKSESETGLVSPPPSSRRGSASCTKSASRPKPSVSKRIKNGVVSVILRIPPRSMSFPLPSPRRRLIPEVYISTRPPTSVLRNDQLSCSPLTPASTPPAVDRRNPGVGGTDVELVRSEIPSSPLTEIDHEDSDVDVIDDADTLPVLSGALLRTAQFGLRGGSDT
ncbi:hypothetical protein EW146_g1883 [Bondarzewia mesenterica]|uniref:Deacetylase sirtuin-type domain-containing protein n=1 Tax=Bondarzewia mesenterica TaxID=1095465 RepID=A0A4V3XFX6_9AGAM|nr:hypothetical protein EW146_g1883 [Bondarzewia mesenterica]